jgi:hypothetical protein
MRQLRGKQALPWMGAALWAALLAMPGNANARPYDPQDMPTPEGDPTADDQPSPTPKGGRYYSGHATTPDLTLSAKRRETFSRMIWLAYVRTWIRISLR